MVQFLWQILLNFKLMAIDIWVLRKIYRGTSYQFMYNDFICKSNYFLPRLVAVGEELEFRVRFSFEWSDC